MREKKKRKYNLKKFYKRMFFLNFLIVLVFLILIFRAEIVGFVNRQTGLSLNAPNVNTEWIGKLWNKDKKEETEDDENEHNEDTEERAYVEDDGSVFSKRFNEINKNTVIGMNYSGIDNSPESLAAASNSIYKAKIKAVSPVVSNNLIRAEITAEVQEVYKGRDAQTIRMFAFGGDVEKSRLEGQVKAASIKTDRSDDSVNVLMDFCDQIEEGKTYIIFTNNIDGIISPTSGNMSFFKVSGRKVTRTGYENETFSMGLKEFEKQYLKK